MAQQNRDAGANVDVKAGWEKIKAAADANIRKTKGQTVAEKRETEKPAVGKADGRRLRRTGRNTQMNLKVRKEVREEFLALAARRKISMGELLEQLLAERNATGGKA